MTTPSRIASLLILAAVLCFLYAFLMIINGNSIFNFIAGVLFFVAGFGLLKRQLWGGYLCLAGCVLLLVGGVRVVLAMRGGAGRDMGLAAAPTALLGVLAVIMAVVTAVIVWLAWGHLKKGSAPGQ
jgi:hypothetical protein